MPQIKGDPVLPDEVTTKESSTQSPIAPPSVTATAAVRTAVVAGPAMSKT
jgi:hypothetical protein